MGLKAIQFSDKIEKAVERGAFLLRCNKSELVRRALKFYLECFEDEEIKNLIREEHKQGGVKIGRPKTKQVYPFIEEEF